MNFTIKGKNYALILGNWSNLLNEVETKIKDCKKITRAPHTAQTGYTQSGLMYEKQRATLLYLMRGYSRGNLNHFGFLNHKRHLETMELLLKTGWAQEVIGYCLKELPHPADVPIARIEVKNDDTVAANGAHRTEADRGERVGIVSAAFAGAANLLSCLQSTVRGTDRT